MKLPAKFKKTRVRQSGFTLIELLVVMGIMAILLAITLIAINPTKHFQDTRNTKRSSDVTAILNAIYEYESSNTGNLPPSLSSLTTTPTPIAGGTGHSSDINLCSDLTPTFIADLPVDPNSTYGTVTGGTTPCGSGTTSYDTGYEIAKTTSGDRFTVSAPHAEDGASISVTR